MTDESGATVMSGGPYSTSGTTFTSTACLEVGCYNLIVNDSFGDGICCAYGNGSYTVKVDGTTAGLDGWRIHHDHHLNDFCVELSGVPGCTLVRCMQLQSSGHGGRRLLRLPVQRSLRR